MRPLAPHTPRPSLTPSRARTADLGPTCQSYPPPQYVDGWHTAQGQVSGSGAVSLSFQLRAGPQKWTGQLSGNGTRIVWAQPPPAPPGPGPGPGPGPNPSLPTVPPGAWVRDGTDALQQAGTLTSISLTACTSASAGNISNRDGYLRCAGSVRCGALAAQSEASLRGSCEWTDTPPPRVGPLTEDGFTNASHTCRYIHHTTFASPRYRCAATPVAAGLLQPAPLSSEVPRAATTARCLRRLSCCRRSSGRISAAHGAASVTTERTLILPSSSMPAAPAVSA